MFRLRALRPSCSAIRQDSRDFEFASARLRKSEAVVVLALQEFRDISMLKFVPREYRDNEAVMLYAQLQATNVP